MTDVMQSFLIGAGVTALVLALGALPFVWLLGRRPRRQQTVLVESEPTRCPECGSVRVFSLNVQTNEEPPRCWLFCAMCGCGTPWGKEG